MSKQTQLKHILSEYFENNDVPKVGVYKTQSILAESMQNSVPIMPEVCSWEVYDDPERFSKTYKFQERNRLRDFIRDLLTFEDNFDHHGTHKIANNSVTVEVYTHDVNKITELDQEYAKMADMIFQDVLDYGY